MRKNDKKSNLKNNNESIEAIEEVSYSKTTWLMIIKI